MKLEHLRKRADFSVVFRYGERKRGNVITLYLTNKNGKDRIRVGVSTAKKFAPRAVDRNYIRRTVYAFFKESPGKADKGTYVVKLSKDVRNMNRRELGVAIRQELARLIEKIGQNN